MIEDVFADFGMYRNEDDVYSFDEFVQFLEESLLWFEKNYRKIFIIIKKLLKLCLKKKKRKNEIRNFPLNRIRTNLIEFLNIRTMLHIETMLQTKMMCKAIVQFYEYKLKIMYSNIVETESSTRFKIAIAVQIIRTKYHLIAF